MLMEFKEFANQKKNVSCIRFVLSFHGFKIAEETFYMNDEFIYYV